MNSKQVVIYCRVSSKKQVNDGNGLDSQEQKCRIWCEHKGYKVLRVFKEKGVSGGKKDRPAFSEMLDFLSNLNEPCIVLVEDLNRWSRDTMNHFLLKKQIVSMGHQLQSVNMTLDDTDESELMESMSASISQYERKKNAKRAKSCMLEHLKQGFWLMTPPVGYRRKKINGRIHCVRLESTATHIQEALEGYANDRFVTQKDVLDFLSDKNLVNFNEKPIKVTFDFVRKMLKNKRYTGIFSYDKWNIPEQTWAIEPLITMETYNIIQYKLKKKGNPLKEHKYVLDDETFPLRRWVLCSECGKPLTASKSRGKSGKYHPYYHCHNRDCSMRGKGIKIDDIHLAFEKLLSEITPPNQLIKLAEAFILEKCKSEEINFKKQRRQLVTDIETLTSEKEKCFQLLLREANNQAISQLCENKITELDIKLSNCKRQLESDENERAQKIQENSQYVLDFLSNPLGIWKIGNFRQRRGVLNLCFTEPITYNREEKFGTPILSPIYGLFQDFPSSTINWYARGDSNA